MYIKTFLPSVFFSDKMLCFKAAQSVSEIYNGFVKRRSHISQILLRCSQIPS